MDECNNQKNQQNMEEESIEATQEELWEQLQYEINGDDDCRLTEEMVNYLIAQGWELTNINL
jgi:hypothetical protein